MRLARGGDDEAYRHLLAELPIWFRMVGRGGLVRGGRGGDDSDDMVEEQRLGVRPNAISWVRMRSLGPFLPDIARHRWVHRGRQRGYRGHLEMDEHLETLSAPQAVEEGAS